MQICTSLQTDNHASTPLLSFLQAGCPSCHPTNSVKALKALYLTTSHLAKMAHRILCDPSKSAAILLGTRHRLLSFPAVPSVNIASLSVAVTDQITTLCVIIDKHFTFDTAFLHSARNSFPSSCPGAHTFISYKGHGCIYSKCSGSILPHYSNSFLFDCSVSNTAKLQRIQNTAAGIVLNTDDCAIPSSCSSTCTGCLFISLSSIK